MTALENEPGSAPPAPKVSRTRDPEPAPGGMGRTERHMKNPRIEVRARRARQRLIVAQRPSFALPPDVSIVAGSSITIESTLCPAT